MKTDDDYKTAMLIVRGHIEQMLDQHDMCAHIVLAMPGRVEVFQNVEATWSNLTIVADEHGRMGLRLKSKKADYADKPELKRRHLEASVGLVSAMAEVLGQDALAYINAAQVFDEATEAEHSPLKPEPKQ